MAKVKYTIGDIVMIPIGDTRFAFGRILNDASIAIFSYLASNIIDVSELWEREVLFDPGVFDTEIVSGNWKIIGKIPFKNHEESWPSPKYIQDVINPNKFRIYHKGEMREATKDEVEGLEKQVMYKPDGLINEIKKRLSKTGSEN